MKKTLSLALALTMLLGILAGCGTTTDSASEPASATAAAAASQAPAVSQAAEAAGSTDISEASSSEASAVEAGGAVDPTSIDASDLYPVFDEMTTISAFFNIAPWASAYVGEGKQFENAKAILVAEDKTNVHLDVDWSDPDTYTEKLNLLMAGGDLPDLIKDAAGSYTGGVDGLINDDLCVDIYPYFEQYAPNYYAILQAYPNFKAKTTSTTGKAVSMFSFTETPLYTRGPIVRKDMLDSAGLEIPTTVDELHDVALGLKSAGVEFPVVSPSFTRWAYNAQDIGGSNAAGFDLTWLAIDGKITPAITLDSQKEWVTEMNKWNSEGLFVEDWYNPLPFYDMYVMADRLAIANGPYTITSDAQKSAATNPDTVDIVPMANVVVNKGDTIKSIDNSIGGVGDGNWCITSACDDIPALVSYTNWFFTDEGVTVSNFGVEGEAFEYDADGNPQFTDLILKDPNGFGSMAVYAIYTNNNDNPFYFKSERISLTYDNDVEATVYDTWLSNVTSDYVANIYRNEEETTRYNNIATDINTTVSEQLTKFVTGDIPMDQWDSFISSLHDMGLDDLTAIQQEAYDRDNA